MGPRAQKGTLGVWARTPRPKTSTNHWESVKIQCVGKMTVFGRFCESVDGHIVPKKETVLIISQSFSPFFVFAHVLFIFLLFFCKHSTTQHKQHTTYTIHKHAQHTYTIHSTTHHITSHHTTSHFANVLCSFWWSWRLFPAKPSWSGLFNEDEDGTSFGLFRFVFLSLGFGFLFHCVVFVRVSGSVWTRKMVNYA